MVQNKGLIFKAVPDGVPVVGENLAVETREFELDQVPPEGGITTKNFYASFDPYQLGRMNIHRKSYIPPFTIGQPISNFTIAKILKSDNDKVKPGDLIVGPISTEEYSATPKWIVDTYIHKLHNPLDLDPVLFIGPLGMSGLTAYSSYYDIGKPIKGETIFISAASGAVGQIVGQLAKHDGLTVIGSVGSQEKLDFITKELGFDGGFNYKTEKPVDALKRLAPKGIDIYFDNVGAEQLDAAFEVMNDFGRIVACGMIADRTSKERYVMTGMTNIVTKRLTMRGFIVNDKNMGPVYAEEHAKNVSKYIKDGSFKVKLSITDGIDNAAEGFIGMLQGKNFGKALVRIADLNADS
jgi:NADPH-dependent curcumin reductase CurA